MTPFQLELLSELNKHLPMTIIVGLDKAKAFYRDQSTQPDYSRFHGSYARRVKLGEEFIVWCPETNHKEYGISPLFHELIHATGPRLEREMFQPKNSYKHCMEEVIAEMGAVNLMEHFGLRTKKNYEMSMVYIAEYAILLMDEDIMKCRKASANAVLYVLCNWLPDLNEKHMLRRAI